MNKLLIITLLLLSGCATVPCVNKTIDSVGACNMGRCGVRFTDGSLGNLYEPVQGDTVCTYQ